jgi:hypothetical protein
MSAELRQVDICYDYTYGQNGNYVTAENLEDAIISGTFDSSKPIDVKLYFKNLENSDVILDDVKLDVDPIDTQEVKYKRDSTEVVRPGSSSYESVDDVNVSDSYDNDIDIGTVNGLDYFYTKYSLTPQKSDINTTINATLKFTLKVETGSDTVVLENSQQSINSMSICSGGAFYKPVKGIFNVVHNGMVKDEAQELYYYNIPTQVVGRAGNFKVQAYEVDNLDEPKKVGTIVGVELLSMDGFHYSTATCTDDNATVLNNERIWIILDDSSSLKDIDKEELRAKGFLSSAAQNAAFRVTYNTANDDGDVFLVQKESNGDYTILNWRTEWEGETCSQDMDGNPNNSDMVASYCNDTGNNPNDLAICMECVYGKSTKVTCSRDNFAIRPEAFHMVLKDGSIVIPEGTALNHIAAGYDYRLDINATSYNSADASLRYNKGFSTNNTGEDLFQYKWNDGNITACNDITNKNIGATFSDGVASVNTSVDQVGTYLLMLRDKTWTYVDANSYYMGHHTGDYYKSSTQKDCVADSGLVNDESSSQLNGCEIRSDYSPRNFYDYLLEIHPYKFGLASITASHNLDNDSISSTSYVYNADIQRSTATGVYPDIDMSYHRYGSIEAQGKNSTVLTNFVDGCYAKNLSLDINKTDYADTNMTLKSALETLDGNNTRVAINFAEHTNGVLSENVAASDFVKTLQGKANIRLRVNFNRAVNVARNPQEITFGDLSVDCTTASECSSIADGVTTHTPQSTKTFNDTVKFYYAKAHSQDSVISGSSGNVVINYEIYCYDTGCDRTLLPNGTASQNSDDPRWWVNQNHTTSYGQVSSVTQKRTPVHVTPSGLGLNSVTLTYDENRGYPYRATMNIVPDNWLIFNKYDATADHNEFNVQFNDDRSEWIGSAEQGTTTTETKKPGYKDRKLTW